MKFQKKFWFFCILAVLMGTTFTLLLRSRPLTTEYRALIEKAKLVEKEERDYFDRLVFTRSPLKAPGSAHFKIIVRDQLNREWLFKGGTTATDGALTAYRFFQLFGLETPEIYRKELPINDERVPGTVQLYISHVGNLNQDDFVSMGTGAVDYIAKNQVLGWLIANHHVHLKQFIVTKRMEGAAQTLMRIDNSIEWTLVGQDQLSLHYTTPVLSRMSSLGYLAFWRGYLTGFYDVPFASIHAWATTIQNIPDDYFRSVFADGVKNNSEYFTNISPRFMKIVHPEIMARAKPNSYLDMLVARKNRLAADTAAFFQQIAADRGEQVVFAASPEAQREVLATWMRSLDARLARIQLDKELLARAPPTEQKPIESANSYKAQTMLAYDFLLPSFLMTSAEEKKALSRKFIDELRTLEQTEYPSKRKAIGTMLGHLERLHHSPQLNKMLSREFTRELLLTGNEIFKPDFKFYYEIAESLKSAH